MADGTSGKINRDLANWLMAQRLEIERVMQARLGAAAPAASGPEAETLRRFRTFVSTALMRGEAPRPVLDGLRPNERRVMALLTTWAEAACELAGPDAEPVGTALAPLLDAFRLAIRTTGSKRKTSGRPRATRRAITAAIDRISDLFFAIDVDSGEILDANPAAGAALGVARDALIGLEFNAFVPVDAQGPWWTSLDSIAEGQDSQIFEADMQDRDSRRLRLEVSATRFVRSSSRILALVVARPNARVDATVDAHPPTQTLSPSEGAAYVKNAKPSAAPATPHDTAPSATVPTSPASAPAGAGTSHPTPASASAAPQTHPASGKPFA